MFGCSEDRSLLRKEDRLIGGGLCPPETAFGQRIRVHFGSDPWGARGGPSEAPRERRSRYDARRTRRPRSSPRNLAVVSMLFSSDSTTRLSRVSFSKRSAS